MTGVEVRFDLFAEFRTRHTWHDNVTQYDAWHIFLYDIQCLYTVGSGSDLIERFEDTCQHLLDGFVVFHYQHFRIFDAFVVFLLPFGIGQYFYGWNDCFRLLLNVGVGVVPYDLFLSKVLVARFQRNDKTASLARFALYTDGSVMKFDDTFCQRQSDACAGSGIQRVEAFGLVETVEYLVDLGGGNACSRVFDLDNDVFILLRYVDGDGIFRFRMLQCVGQQIVHYLLHLLLVVPYFNIIRLLVELEIDLLAAGVFKE